MPTLAVGGAMGVLAGWRAAAVAKVKAAAVVLACVTAGAVGGVVALSHVAPVDQQVSPSKDQHGARVSAAPMPSRATPTTGAAFSPTPSPHPSAPRPTYAAPTHPPPTYVPTVVPTPTPRQANVAAPVPSCAAPRHGAAVSTTAHSAHPGKDHGGTVATTAHSHCGKR